MWIYLYNMDNTPTYNQVPLSRGLISHESTYDTAIRVAECERDIRIKTNTPYLTLTGELWGAYCEDFRENWPHYNDTVLYKDISLMGAIIIILVFIFEAMVIVVVIVVVLPNPILVLLLLSLSS